MSATSHVRPAVTSEVQHRNRRLGFWVAMGSLSMLAFAPVLYWTGGLLCDWAGIGFNPDQVEKQLREDRAADAPLLPADAQRRVRVTLSPAMDQSLKRQLSFTVAERTQEVTVGELADNSFVLRNRSDRAVFVRPIHSVTPPEANRHFLMTQCFCYNDMKLKAGESRTLRVRYGFQEAMDVRVRQALLGYRLEPIASHEMRPERDGFDDDASKDAP